MTGIIKCLNFVLYFNNKHLNLPEHSFPYLIQFLGSATFFIKFATVSSIFALVSSDVEPDILMTAGKKSSNKVALSEASCISSEILDNTVKSLCLRPPLPVILRCRQDNTDEMCGRSSLVPKFRSSFTVRGRKSKGLASGNSLTTGQIRMK